MAINIIPIEPDRTIRIKFKDLNTSSMEITDKGMELELREVDGKHIGDLLITPTKITWNKGKTSKFGKSINWPEFLKFMQKRN